MTYEGLGEMFMFEGDSADMCAGKFPLMSMGGRAEGLACADPGARTPIGASGNLVITLDSCAINPPFLITGEPILEFYPSQFSCFLQNLVFTTASGISN